MNYNFDDYLNVVKLNIKNQKLHAPICTELESHLQDSADFYVEIGYDEATANEKALADMGDPIPVGESMAKIYKLSGWQKLWLTVFFFVISLKLIDLLLSCVYVHGWIGNLFYEPIGDFEFIGEFISMLITVAVGFVMALRTKRIAPAVAVMLIPVLDVSSIWVFSFVSWVAIRGKLDEYLTAVREYDYIPKFNVIDYVVPIVISVLAVSVLIFAFVSIIRIIKKPFSDSRRIKKNATVLMLVLVSVSIAIYMGIFNYVDKKDNAQFEMYSQVVADMCDLCLENGKLTAEDFDMVMDKFDYLDFVEADQNWWGSYYDTALEAEIGEATMISSRLYIGKGSNGSFSIVAYASRLDNQFDLSLRYFGFIKYVEYNNRWEGSLDVADFLIDFTNNAQVGDSLDGYLNKIKETGSAFAYTYDASTNEELYTTELDMSGLFGQWYYYISADDGKFVSASDMID